MTHRQIKVWRQPTSVSVQLEATRSAEHELRQLIIAIQQALGVQDWHNFGRMLQTCCNVFMPERHTPMGFGVRRRSPAQILKRKMEWVDIEEFKAFGLKIEDETFTATPREPVTITIGRTFTGGHEFNSDGHSIVFTVASDSEVEIIAEVQDRVGSVDRGRHMGSYHLQLGETTYTSVLYVQAWTQRHWAFSKGSKERLGDRLQEPPYDCFRRDAPIYQVEPLEDEELVVYESSGAHNVGLEVPFSRTAPRHPDRQVFASVGPFSLALRKGERRGRSPARDRIVVFRDDKLPIVPPEVDDEECDDSGWDCDEFDFADRYDAEY